MKNKLNFKTSFIFLVFLIINISCVTVKKVEYFRDIKEFSEPTVNPMTQKEIIPFDKLSIIVLSTDQETAKILNFPTEVENFMGNAERTGFLVDEEGNIYFPFVGKIKVEGFTIIEAAQEIKTSISGLVPNPEVIVSFLDNRVTVLGQVNNQGMHTINREKINIFEAIGLGGGITDFGDRRKVVLMRMEEDKPTFHRINLTSSQIAYSEYFYVLPNDVIFVEPLRAKIYIQNSVYRDVFLTVTSLITTAIIYFGLRQ
jgi:polysaccharide biosynthesis/export protein